MNDFALSLFYLARALRQRDDLQFIFDRSDDEVTLLAWQGENNIVYSGSLNAQSPGRVRQACDARQETEEKEERLCDMNGVSEESRSAEEA